MYEIEKFNLDKFNSELLYDNFYKKKAINIYKIFYNMDYSNFNNYDLLIESSLETRDIVNFFDKYKDGSDEGYTRDIPLSFINNINLCTRKYFSYIYYNFHTDFRKRIIVYDSTFCDYCLKENFKQIKI